MTPELEHARGVLIGQSHALVVAAEGTVKMLHAKATDPLTDPWTARSLAEEAARLETGTRAWRDADTAYEAAYKALERRYSRNGHYCAH